HLWAMICFGTHQYLASTSRQDGLFWKVLVLLRSEMSELGISWRLLEIGWLRRRQPPKARKRLIPLIILCILHFVVFAVAGLFSSRVADAANEVLIEPSNHCGVMDTSLANPVSRTHALSPKEVADIDAA